MDNLAIIVKSRRGRKKKTTKKKKKMKKKKTKQCGFNPIFQFILNGYILNCSRIMNFSCEL